VSIGCLRRQHVDVTSRVTGPVLPRTVRVMPQRVQPLRRQVQRAVESTQVCLPSSSDPLIVEAPRPYLHTCAGYRVDPSVVDGCHCVALCAQQFEMIHAEAQVLLPHLAAGRSVVPRATGTSRVLAQPAVNEIQRSTNPELCQLFGWGSAP
jgi:hypothetical protein